MLLRNSLRILATKKKPSTKFAGPGRTVSRAVVLAPLTPFPGRVRDQENIELEDRRGTMTKAVIVTLADTESNEGLARVVNALTVTKEFKEEGHKVNIVFNGAGTTWVG
jgi:hypothetical protein